MTSTSTVPSVRRIVLTFGLIAGGILSLMMLISMSFMDQIGFDRAEVIGYTTMVLAFLLVFFGVRSYRDTMTDGTIGFWKAFGVGLLIVAVASACYMVAWEFISYFVVPDFLDKYTAHALAQAQAAGATAEQLAAQAREMERYKALYANPLIHAAITFVEPFPVGIVMSLVSAGILRRARAPGVGAVSIGSTSPIPS